jgi:Staphylococcal nuclease homologue
MSVKNVIFLILFLVSGVFYYGITVPVTDFQTYNISKIIDGDTVRLQGGQTLRLLGINTPEKNELYYQEAKDFLIQRTQNRTVQIETFGVGKYGRTLAYVFLDGQNVNAEILLQGLATLYYYDKDCYYQNLKDAEEFARLNERGLWGKSENFGCLEILKFETDEPESLVFRNSCGRVLNISYKDDATHIYHATIRSGSQYSKSFSHIWNTDGDSLYVYDADGLVLFYRY